MSSIELRPGIVNGTYPERQEKRQLNLTEIVSSTRSHLFNVPYPKPAQQQRIIALIDRHAKTFKRLDDRAITTYLQRLGLQLKKQGLCEPLLAQSFAIIREVAGRTLGMRHHDVQLICGWYLMQGMLTEMNTGEGKTLTASLAAATAAFADIPVHVITANDYLVTRDANTMTPLYHALGLKVGAVIETMDLTTRQQQYAANITYCTNKQIAFDYLRDRITMGQHKDIQQLELENLHKKQGRLDKLLLPGLYFAIVDEADSVLIDEARTPLVISKNSPNSSQEEAYQQALTLARQLDLDVHFTLNMRKHLITLTDNGHDRLDQLCVALPGIWQGPRRRNYLVTQALSALHLYKRDRHYIITQGKVHIIDEYTGRTMADRAWEEGLHQMIETKEGLEITGNRETLARISYQKFFRRYLHLAGMSGTASEIASETSAVYGLQVIRIPPHKVSQRQILPDQVFWCEQDKWNAIVNKIREIHSTGRPILIGTPSVAESEHLSRLLHEQQLHHRVLNARQNRNEAEIIAQAGQPSRITVATNMAGRGTDISLAQSVSQLGGLYVLITARHDSRRIDRQLFGRCARQGDPGGCAAIVSLEDELIVRYLPAWLSIWLQNKIASRQGLSAGTFGRFIIWLAQTLAQRQHRIMRKLLIKNDEQRDEMLSFSGKAE